MDFFELSKEALADFEESPEVLAAYTAGSEAVRRRIDQIRGLMTRFVG